MPREGFDERTKASTGWLAVLALVLLYQSEHRVHAQSAHTRFSEAVARLGDADHGRETVVDLVRITQLADELRAENDPRARARAEYLTARVAAAGGSYQRAAALGTAALPHLEPELSSELELLIAQWQVLKFTQYGGSLMLGDRDSVLVGSNDALLAALKLKKGATPMRARLDAYRTRGLGLAILAGAGSMAIPENILQLDALRRVICSKEPCADYDELASLLLAWYGRTADARASSERAAVVWSKTGFHDAAALAWLQAADISITSRSTPLELNFQPDNPQTVLLRNSGKPLPEFFPIPNAALRRAEKLYAKAQSAAKSNTALRGQLLARQGYVAWQRENYALAAKLYAESRDALDTARYGRPAIRAAAAALISALAAHVDPQPHARAFERLVAAEPDFGLLLSTAKIFDRAGMLLESVRGDSAGAYTARDHALRILHRIPTHWTLPVVLDNQARLLREIGESRQAIGFSIEALDLTRANLVSAGPASDMLVLQAFQNALAIYTACQALQDLACAQAADTHLDELGALLAKANGPTSALSAPMARMRKFQLAVLARDYRSALELARASNDVTQQAIVLARMGDNAAVGKLLESAASELSKVDRKALANEFMRQGLRSTVRSNVQVLLTTHNAKQAAALYEAARPVFDGTLFGGDDTPWERSHIQARLAEELGQDERADAEYSRALSELNARAQKNAELFSEASFDDQTAYLTRDYVAFLLKHRRMAEGLLHLEQFRAKESRLALLGALALKGSATREVAAWRSASARLQMLTQQAGAAATAAESSAMLGRIDAVRAEVIAARRKVLSALGGAAAQERAFDDLWKRTLQRVEHSGQTLLVYHIYGDSSSVVVLRPGAAPEVRALPITNQGIVEQSAKFVGDLANADDHWTESASTLYDLLIAPIEDLLPVARPGQPALVGIVPFGPLHEVAFSALTHRGRALIADYDLFFVPSLLAYAAERPSPGPVALEPVDALGFNGVRLAEAEPEARLIAAGASVGAGATSEHLFGLLARPGTLHVAAHAELDPVHPLSSFLRLADGDLHLLQLPGHELRKSLIVLSACQTARGDARRSDQRTDFATTFLEHGVGSVMVTGWEIDDALTRPLMSDFYAELHTTRDPVHALAEAQRKAIAAGGDRAHPGFWSPFWLVGGRQ